MQGVLSRQEILAGIKSQPPLVEAYLDLAAQLQVNGFDMTLRSLRRLTSAGQLALDNSQRVLPEAAELPFEDDGWLLLSPGSYMLVFNEIVNLPLNVMALGRSRSSLLRCGASLHTAVWDAGYHGRSESLLVVHNVHGLRLKQDARLMQMVFMYLAQETEAYRGRYQGENTL